MPRLSTNQQEQAIGRSKAEQSTQIIAYNINIRTIYYRQHRYNATNDHPHSGHPHYDKIALFCATDLPQLRWCVIPLEHSNHPSVPTPFTATWPTTISIVDVLLEVLFLQTITGMSAMGHSL